MVVISTEAYNSVLKFYEYVAKKYEYSYSLQNMIKNIQEIYNAMKNITENSFRMPRLDKHRQVGYKEATYIRNGSKIDWYFECLVENTLFGIEITVAHAFHKSQMHEPKDYLDSIITEQIHRLILENKRKI